MLTLHRYFAWESHANRYTGTLPGNHMLIVTQVLFLKADCYTAAWFSVVTERCPGCGRLCRRPQNQNIARWYHWFSCSSNGLLLRRIFGMEKSILYKPYITVHNYCLPLPLHEHSWLLLPLIRRGLLCSLLQDRLCFVFIYTLFELYLYNTGSKQ